MHFISLVASERRNGNSDLLGRLAVRYALKAGVDSGETVYLKDFDVRQCRGCLQCVFKNENCKINDDLYRLTDIIQEADKLLLIAPVYVLSVPGKLKLLLDRFLSFSNYREDGNGKHAMSIGIAALSDWHQLHLPLMNLLLLAMGYRVVNSLMFYGAGPGEVLLADGIKEFPNVIRDFVVYHDQSFRTLTSDHCPVDFSRVFEWIGDDYYRCPICLTPAKKVDNGYYFDAQDLNNHRWTRQKIREHFVDWILKTKPWFKSRLGEILRQKHELNL